MEWISLNDQLPEEGEELIIMTDEGIVIDLEDVFYIGFQEPMGHQFVTDDYFGEGTAYFTNVSHWKLREELALK